MSDRSGLSRGDRNRNARLARLRQLLPPENAIVGIDLADEKQAAVVTDGPPRVFRTAELKLFHAASCRFRYSSWTSCGVLYPSAEWRRVRLYRSSMYRAISSLAFFLVG
jgi:hypothetical protein